MYTVGILSSFSREALTEAAMDAIAAAILKPLVDLHGDDLVVVGYRANVQLGAAVRRECGKLKIRHAEYTLFAPYGSNTRAEDGRRLRGGTLYAYWAVCNEFRFIDVTPPAGHRSWVSEFQVLYDAIEAVRISGDGDVPPHAILRIANAGYTVASRYPENLIVSY